MPDIPRFSYEGIVNEAKYIDVIWFNKQGYAFPKCVFEVVDSVSTLNGAFNRSFQLKNFDTSFTIVAPEKHRNKYERTLELEIYKPQENRFNFINYDDIIDFYETSVRRNRMEVKLFGWCLLGRNGSRVFDKIIIKSRYCHEIILSDVLPM